MLNATKIHVRDLMTTDTIFIGNFRYAVKSIERTEHGAYAVTIDTDYCQVMSGDDCVWILERESTVSTGRQADDALVAGGWLTPDPYASESAQSMQITPRDVVTEMCGCEHYSHFEDSHYGPKTGHDYRAVPAGKKAHPWVGGICDNCAETCLSIYSLTDRA